MADSEADAELLRKETTDKFVGQKEKDAKEAFTKAAEAKSGGTKAKATGESEAPKVTPA